MRSRSVHYWKLASNWATSLAVNTNRSGVNIFTPHVRYKANVTGQGGSSGQRGTSGKGVTVPGALRFRGPTSKASSKLRHSDKNVLSKPSKDAWNVVGYSTAETFDLVSLEQHLKSKGVYDVHCSHEELSQTCIVARAKLFISEDTDPPENEGNAVANDVINKPRREIFFFSDGSVIFWSVPTLEREMMLRLLRDPQIAVGPYDQDTVFDESELMTFKVDTSSEAVRTHLDSKGTINLVIGSNPDKDSLSRNHLEKFAFSNAMAASVKLGALEASLDNIIDSIEFLSEDMKRGKPFATSRKEVLKKSGELFALRHVLNLSSDLLDTPDFYWDRENLESMYLSTCAHLAIGKRIRITNEKISHCVELLDLVRNHLNDDHHTKLEWYIIILIMIEVCFEVLHLVDRMV